VKTSFNLTKNEKGRIVMKYLACETSYRNVGKLFFTLFLDMLVNYFSTYFCKLFRI